MMKSVHWLDALNMLVGWQVRLAPNGPKGTVVKEGNTGFYAINGRSFHITDVTHVQFSMMGTMGPNEDVITVEE